MNERLRMLARVWGDEDDKNRADLYDEPELRGDPRDCPKAKKIKGVLTLILLPVGILFVLASGVGEFVWLPMLAWIPIRCWQKWRGRWQFKIALPLCASILLLHSQGYKLYGSPAWSDNNPLPNSSRIVRFSAPNKIHFADGKVVALPELMFDMNRMGDSVADWGGELTRGVPLEGVAERDSSGKMVVWVKKRSSMICGNALFPWFFPKALPRYRRQDLGVLLVRREFVTEAGAPKQTKRASPAVKVNVSF